MMDRNIAVRTIRVEKVFATDETVRKNHARDKVCTFLTFMSTLIVEHKLDTMQSLEFSDGASKLSMNFSRFDSQRC